MRVNIHLFEAKYHAEEAKKMLEPIAPEIAKQIGHCIENIDKVTSEIRKGAKE